MTLRRVALLLVAGGCTSAEPDPPDAPPPVVEYLSPTEHLVRASLTLRGTRPSVADLERVAADPEALPEIVDTYIASPEFGGVMRDLHAETLLVRVDLQGSTFRPMGPVADRTAGEMNTIYEEPLRLIEHVIVNDRPYSEIVTADYAISDPITAAVWGMTHGGGEGTEVAQWLDQRPVAGILSSSALWARHTAAGMNHHRSRANLISNALLCFDFLHSDINLDTSLDLADPEVVANAVRTNASCVGCHQTLDPLASTLFGFQPGARYPSYPVPMYRTEWEHGWQDTTHRPPAYFGQAAATVRDVGQLIAVDPRFPRCTASRFAAYFTQTPRAEVPFAWVARLTDAFIASNLDAKQLAREIVLSDEFRVSHASATATADEADGVNGMLRLRPEQLDTMFRDLTGIAWTTTSQIPIFGVPYGQANLLRTDFLGYRALAGGLDGYYVTRPTHTTNAVGSLVLRTLAATAAGFVVDADFAAPAASRRLLTGVEATTVDEPTVRAQLAKLHARIYGTLDAPDSAEVGETYALFAASLARLGEVRRTWKVTITAMLGDLRVAHY